MLMSSYQAIGDEEGIRRAARMALSRAEQALAQDHVNGTAMGSGVGALAALGQVERARALIERGLLIEPDNVNMRYNFACGVSAFLKDVDGALELLAPVFATASSSLLRHAERDPDLVAVRGDPRFEAMFAAAKSRLATAGALAVR
jgi:adenylate cyclase